MGIQNVSHVSANDDLLVWNLNAKVSLHFYPAGIYVIVMIILGIPGNFLVIYVYNYHFKSSNATFFIKVLAIIDVLCCIFGMTYETVDLFFPLLNGEPYTCKIFRTIEQTSEFISGLVILLITYDRYLHVCNPFRTFSVYTARKYVYIAVAIGFFLSSPTLLIIGKRTTIINDIKVYKCSRDDKFRETLAPFLYYLFIYAILGVTFFVVVVQYICIWSAIHKWRRSPVGHTSKVFATHMSKLGPQRDNGNDESPGMATTNPNTRGDDTGHSSATDGTQNNRTRRFDDSLVRDRNRMALRRKKVIKPVIVLFAVTFVFVISFLPYFIIIMLESTGTVYLEHLTFENRQVLEVFYKSYFLSNVMNPIIYGIFDFRFRRKCFDILFRRGYYARMCW